MVRRFGILCALAIVFASIAPAQQAPDSRPRKALPLDDQIKLLKAKDAFDSAAASAEKAITQARDAQAKASNALVDLRKVTEGIAKKEGCADFDTTGDGVACVTSFTAPKSPASPAAPLPLSSSPPLSPPIPPSASAKH